MIATDVAAVDYIAQRTGAAVQFDRRTSATRCDKPLAHKMQFHIKTIGISPVLKYNSSAHPVVNFRDGTCKHATVRNVKDTQYRYQYYMQ